MVLPGGLNVICQLEKQSGDDGDLQNAHADNPADTAFL